MSALIGSNLNFLNICWNAQSNGTVIQLDLSSYIYRFDGVDYNVTNNFDALWIALDAYLNELAGYALTSLIFGECFLRIALRLYTQLDNDFYLKVYRF